MSNHGDQSAFPFTYDNETAEAQGLGAFGMTYREWLEGKVFAAMQGGSFWGGSNHLAVANEAIKAADALLKAQQRRDEILQPKPDPDPA